MPLGQKDFSAGWQPNADYINGPKNCCLRQDNLCLDEVGALSLCRAETPIFQGAFNGNIIAAYSLFINGNKFRYIGTDNGGIYRNGDGIGVGGNQVAFGSGFGEVFVSSGGLKIKDTGYATLPWGLNAPGGAPTIGVNTAPFINWAAPSVYNTTMTALEGTLGTVAVGNAQVSIDPTTNRAILQNIHAEDLTTFSDGGTAQDNDLFSINVLVPDSAQVISVRVEALLQIPNSMTVSDVTDYYYYEWDAQSSGAFAAGVNQWSTLNTQRVQFQRQGNSSLNWSNVQAVRVIFLLNPPVSNTSSTTCQLGTPFAFYGGSNAQLFGGQGSGYTPYTLFQVNVYNSGTYLGASPISPITPQITAIAQSIFITPYVLGIDSQVNEIWFYIQGGTLESPYFATKSVKTGGVFPSVSYGASDVAALLLNIIPNTFLASILTQINGNVIDIEGPCNGRMVLLTQQNVIFTDYLNPESFDSRMVLTLSGAVGETNLFMARIGQATLLVGTTNDVYQITGTFQQLPDGTFDVAISALGLKQPPISSSYTIKDYTLYYVANDGIKALAFSLTNTISGTLQLLWRGLSRYGVPGISTSISTSPQQLTYYKGKLSGIFTHVDNTRSIIELDLLGSKTWNRRLTPSSPTLIYCEADGECLIANGKQLYQFDSGNSVPLNINLQLPAQDGQEPYSRKDLFTLKIIASGGPVDVYLQDESQPTPNQFLAGTNVTFPGNLITNLDVTGCPIDLSKRYALNILDHANAGITAFALYEWWLDYISRPPQECFNKVLPNNLGTPSRKRFLQYAIIVDTLGGNCNFTPYVDGKPQTTLQINTSTNGKSTVVYTFKSEVIGIDIWHTVVPTQVDAVVEYYGLALEECISEKMPPLSTYLVIPQNNFGTPSRKRVRTLPMVINTFGYNVSFQPIVDGVPSGVPQVFNTLQKKTVYYYFTIDSFGTDYGGIIQPAADQFFGPDTPINYGQGEFEFYGLLTPETVEELPVPKLYDQFGPYQLDRRGQLYEFRCRILSFTTTINYNVIMDDTSVLTGFFQTKLGVDTVYDIKLPKGIIGAVMRVEISSPDMATAFYCWHAQFRLQKLGLASDAQWITVSGKLEKQ